MKQKSVVSYLHVVKKCFYGIRRCSSSTTELKKTALEVKHREFVEGETYHSFLCRQTKFIPEWNATAYLFQHSKLQCEYLHIDQKAAESTFAIGFRTTGLDLRYETILRNMLLAKTDKFNTSDPYLNIFGRPLSRIGKGYTMFQFSSGNVENIKNLQEIFFEYIFNAKLTYADFLVEGIRLEFSEKLNQYSPIQYNGVAYNQLKKNACRNEGIFERWMKACLLPDYFCTNLFHMQNPSFEELQDVYEKYYHPSNCKFFSFGGFDVGKSLDALNNKFLYKYDYCDIQFSGCKRLKCLSEAQTVHLSCYLEQYGRPFEEQSQTNLAFLMTDLKDVYESFVASTLSRILLHSRNFYFHKEFHNSNLSYGGYSASTGFREVLGRTIFCVGVQNIKAQNFQKFQEKFKEVLENAFIEGIDAEIIQKFLRDLQFEMHCFSGNISKDFLLKSFPTWNCSGDIMKALDLSHLIAQLQENLKEKPKYLNEKIEEYFLNNNHKVTITMSPDPNYIIKFRNTEKAALNDTVLLLNEDQRNEIYNNGIYLLKLQNEKETEQTICNVTLPVPVLENPVDFKLQNMRVRNVPIQIYELPYYDATHFRCIFKASHISPESIRLIPFLCYILNERFGNSSIKFDLHFVEDLNDSCKHEVGIVLKAQLSKDVSQTFNTILQSLSLGTVGEHDLDKYISEMWTNYARNGGKFVIESSRGLVTGSSKIRSELTSLEMIDFMIRLRKSSNMKDTQKNLLALHKALLNTNCMRCLIITSNTQDIKTELEKYLQQFSSQDVISKNHESDILTPSNRHFVLSSPLSYCAQSCLTVPYSHPHHKSLKVLVSVLNYRYFHPYIQELSGASLAGAELGKDGVLTIYSFDSQNPKECFEFMKNTMEWLKKQRFDMESIKIYKLSALVDGKTTLDKMTEVFNYNSTLEVFLKYKKELLNVNQNDIKDVVDKYLTPQQRFSRCFIGAKASQPDLQNERWDTYWE